MRQVAMLAAACLLLAACSSRALRPAEDVWDVATTPQGAGAAAPDDRPDRPLAD
jgi:outer membrane biogenesis lipoprotein LolB